MKGDFNMTTYTAKANDTCAYESIEVVGEDGEKRQESVKHTWTAGKKYNVEINSEEHTMRFTSDAGESQDLPVLSVNKFAFMDVFGIDLEPEYTAAVAAQNASLAAEYRALNI